MTATAPTRLTGVVIAFNEADRIARCVGSLKQVCARVVVLDSGSTDATARIARDAGAEVVQQDWLGFAGQKNAAIAAADTEWVLLLDADEWFEPEALTRLASFLNSGEINHADAWQLPRRTIFLDRPLRHGGWGREWLPRLFRQPLRYCPDLVHERLDLEGRRVHVLDIAFEHTPVRNLDEHYRKLARYAELWAEGRAASGKRAGFLDLYTHPLFYLLKNYLIRGGFRDGREGAVFHLAYAGYTHTKYARLWAKTRATGKR